MRPDRPHTRAQTRSEVQKAVDELVDQEVIQLVDEEAEPFRMIGVVFAPAAYSTGDTDQAEPPEPTDSDTEAIRSLLDGFSRVKPEDAPDCFEDYCTNPYAVVDRSAGTVLMDENQLRQWKRHIGSPDFEAATDGFEPLEPRQVEMSKLQVNYVGDGIAVATFHEVETGQQGWQWVGNGGAVAVKRQSGGEWVWRLAVITKRGTIDKG
jgi:hypothetical protein